MDKIGTRACATTTLTYEPLAEPPVRPRAPLLVFDIETVPDIPLIASSYELELPTRFDVEAHWNDLSVMEALRNQKQVNFPPPIFHIPISICAVFVHPETHVLMDGFKQTIPTPESYAALKNGEARLLRKFWEFTLKYRNHAQDFLRGQRLERLSDYQRRKLMPVPVTFCGYNICGFDLPVIEQRSMRHLLTCPLPEYAREAGYDSYRSKYAIDKCFDLCHFIANNAVGRTGLDVIARAMGLGGKMTGMDGGKVAGQYFEYKNFRQIEEYCAIDVLITYGVFLAVQKFRGVLDTEQFKVCLRQFEKFLNQPGKPPSYAELARQSHEYFSLIHCPNDRESSQEPTSLDEE